MTFSMMGCALPEQRATNEHGIDGCAWQGGFRRPARQWSEFRCGTRPRRRCTYPELRRPLRSNHCGLARSSLKMKRVDPARTRVSALHGVLMSPTSRVGAASAARSSLLPTRDQFFSFRSAIHLHGSTPDRESRVVSGQRAEWHAAEPIRGKHDRVPCLSQWKGRCSIEWRGQVHRHQVPGTTSTVTATRFRERPAMIAGRSQT